jgi:hypothetical protein
LQAADDPIAPAEGIPYNALAANDKCILSGEHSRHLQVPKCDETQVDFFISWQSSACLGAVTPVGGHLGWVSPSNPLGAPAVHDMVVEFFSAVLDSGDAAVTKPPSEGVPVAGMVH